MDRAKVQQKLDDIADDSDQSIFDLRRLWLTEMYEHGCLTHEKFCLLMSWVEAEELIADLDYQIAEFHITIGDN